MSRRHPLHSRLAGRPGTIPAARFKARCLELMNEVRERRTEYVITKHGKPVAKLGACEDAPVEAFGMLAGSVIAHGDIVSPDLNAWGEGEVEKRPRRVRRG